MPEKLLNVPVDEQCINKIIIQIFNTGMPRIEP